MLAEKVRAAAVEVLADRGLDSTVLPESVDLRRPDNPAHGDFATALPLRVGSLVGVAPHDLARWLAHALAGGDEIVAAEAVEPGFVNLRLTNTALTGVVTDIEALGARYGARPPVPDAWQDVDPDLRKRRIPQNPVFAVQHAHARICSVVDNSLKFGMDPTGADLGLVTHEREGAVIRALGEFDGVAPDRVARYLERLADALHRWYDTPECKILPQGDDEVAAVHLARLRLSRAVRQVLANGLGTVGVPAPERM
nr:Arginyl-tRNA synthetase [Kibdelosporangium sp. MJ126-NF4]CTQ92476.1 Arginyl-tRNA synthetase (EC 6.1.1.19) [Kibdelosporangium sp. MJ126-NF4]